MLLSKHNLHPIKTDFSFPSQNWGRGGVMGRAVSIPLTVFSFAIAIAMKLSTHKAYYIINILA